MMAGARSGCCTSLLYDCQLGNWIVMPPLISMLQVNRHVRLSVSTPPDTAPDSSITGMQQGTMHWMADRRALLGYGSVTN